MDNEENLFTGFYENYKIFFEEEEAIMFLTRAYDLDFPLSCKSCFEERIQVRKNAQRKSGIVLRCIKCKKVYSPAKFFREEFPNISLAKILLEAFLYCANSRSYQVVLQVDIAEKTLISLKTVFCNILKNVSETDKIGGPGHVVQIDETACNRRRLLTNHTSLEPYIWGNVWVIGLNSERTGAIRLKVLKNRYSETILTFLRENLEEGTIIKTDGYPSYPSAIRIHNSSHIVVNPVGVFSTKNLIKR